jgi:hypothetical protein
MEKPLYLLGIGDDPNLPASICGEFDFVDIHDHQHGGASMVPTYIRGSKRLDYCLVSPELVNFILFSGINLFNEFAHSDHRALFLDIDLIAYLGAKLPKLAQPDQRSASSSSWHVAKSISKVFDHLQENKDFHKFQEYLLDVDVHPEPWRLANDIDNIVGQKLSRSEKMPAHLSHSTLGRRTFTRPVRKFASTGRHTSLPGNGSELRFSAS